MNFVTVYSDGYRVITMTLRGVVLSDLHRADGTLCGHDKGYLSEIGKDNVQSYHQTISRVLRIVAGLDAGTITFPAKEVLP